MNKMLLAAAGAAAFMSFAAPASAATFVTDLGVLTPGGALSFSTNAFTNANQYNFTFSLASPLLTISQMGASTPTFTDPFTPTPRNVRYSLYSGDPLGVNSLLATSSYAPFTVIGGVLGTGSYFLRINQVQIQGESVSGGVFAPSAVPEPATWAMMIVGLFGVGAFMRRQRRTLAMASAA